jgi:hypothetical protein
VHNILDLFGIHLGIVINIFISQIVLIVISGCSYSFRISTLLSALRSSDNFSNLNHHHDNIDRSIMDPNRDPTPLDLGGVEGADQDR